MVLHNLVPADVLHPDVLLLADLQLAEWPAARKRIRLSGHPTNEGDENAGDGEDREGAGESDGEEDMAAGDEGEGDGDEAEGARPPETDWKKMARRHEREAKKARADATAVAAKLKEREDADKSEQEKAIEAARAEGEQTALSRYEETRRDDRIEMEVIKLAGRDIKIGEGDNAETVKFADPDDAQLRLERAIRKGDITYDDLYADGKVNAAALSEFLTDLLAENPHLRTRAGGDKPPPVVDMDGGKGKGSGGGKSLEDMSPDDHLKAIQSR